MCSARLSPNPGICWPKTCSHALISSRSQRGVLDYATRGMGIIWRVEVSPDEASGVGLEIRYTTYIAMGAGRVKYLTTLQAFADAGPIAALVDPACTERAAKPIPATSPTPRPQRTASRIQTSPKRNTLYITNETVYHNDSLHARAAARAGSAVPMHPDSPAPEHRVRSWPSSCTA